MRPTAALAVTLLLCACVPAPASNGAPLGPELIIDVRNASSGELRVGYDFVAGEVSGTGEGLVLACQRQPVHGGQIGGAYVILVDGKSVFEATVPAAPEGAFLVVNVSIGPDGEVQVSQGGFVRVPPVDPVAIPCG